MFRKFFKEIYHSVFQFILLLAAIAVIMSLTLPDVRFFLSHWFFSQSDQVMSRIGTHGQAFSPTTSSSGNSTGPVLISGDKVNILGAPVITYTPMHSDRAYGADEKITFGATATAANGYAPEPPFFCTWTGGYSGTSCDLSANPAQALGSGTHQVTVELCDSVGACGMSSVTINVSTYPLVQTKLVPSLVKNPYYSTDKIAFTTNTTGGSGTGYTYTWLRNGTQDSTVSSLQSYPRGTPTIVSVTACDKTVPTLCAQDSYSITVMNRPPTAPTNAYVIYPTGKITTNDNVSLGAAGSTDPDNDPITYVWSGTSQSGYYNVGIYTVYVYATDNYGGSSSRIPLTFTVYPGSPTIVPSVDTSNPVSYGTPITFTSNTIVSPSTTQTYECTANCYTQNPTLQPLPSNNIYSSGTHVIASRVISNGLYSDWSFYTFTVGYPPITSVTILANPSTGTIKNTDPIAFEVSNVQGGSGNFTVTWTNYSVGSSQVGVWGGATTYSTQSNQDVTVTAQVCDNKSSSCKTGVYTFHVQSSFTYLDYPYTGGVQTFVAPYTGSFKLEVWGAQGGPYSTYYVGSKGGYSSGIISLTAGQTLYVYVGQMGSSHSQGGIASPKYTFNGGGGSSHGGDGGGGTDIRTIPASTTSTTTWNDNTSLSSRIIVAGGGGGADSSGSGGAGGGTTGISYSVNYGAEGGQQTRGGRNDYTNPLTGWASYYVNSGFGFGAVNNGLNDAGGGGGGWYGGGTQGNGGGGGGSGYIGGVTYPVTIAGNQSFVSPSGVSEFGQSGNGYARISAD